MYQQVLERRSSGLFKNTLYSQISRLCEQAVHVTQTSHSFMSCKVHIKHAVFVFLGRGTASPGNCFATFRDDVAVSSPRIEIPNYSWTHRLV
jgi:hypothetical protein